MTVQRENLQPLFLANFFFKLAINLFFFLWIINYIKATCIPEAHINDFLVQLETTFWFTTINPLSRPILGHKFLIKKVHDENIIRPEFFRLLSLNKYKIVAFHSSHSPTFSYWDWQLLYNPQMKCPIFFITSVLLGFDQRKTQISILLGLAFAKANLILFSRSLCIIPSQSWLGGY